MEKFLQEEAGGANGANRFDHLYAGLTFSYGTSFGEVVELLPGMAEESVTLANAAEWCRAVKNLRLQEFETQVRAMRRGLTRVIPSLYFGFWPWQTLERKVSPVGEFQLPEVLMETPGRYAVIPTFPSSS